MSRFEENSRNLRIDSPTCSREGLRLLFSIAAIKSWKINSIDITSAFLQGGPINREIYLRPPSDICSKDTVWKLKRCIYGLNDAPRAWYEKVREVMIDLGAKVSSYDEAMFCWHDQSGDLVGVLISHVDDFVFCGNNAFQTNIISKLKGKFNMRDHESGTFKYLGLNLNVTQNGECVMINQNAYIAGMTPMSGMKNKSEELNEEEKLELKRMCGQLLWVASQTRPDISFETCVASNTGKHPTFRLCHEINKAIKKLKSSSVDIRFPHLGGVPSDIKVIGYSDATYASLEDGSSQGGLIVFLKGPNNKVAPIIWQSRKLQRVTKSPLASETLALCDVADAAFLVASFLKEIFNLSRMPIIECYTDNKSLIDNLKTSKIINDRRLRVDMARLKEMLRENEIKVFWV